MVYIKASDLLAIKDSDQIRDNINTKREKEDPHKD